MPRSPRTSRQCVRRPTRRQRGSEEAPKKPGRGPKDAQKRRQRGAKEAKKRPGRRQAMAGGGRGGRRRAAGRGRLQARLGRWAVARRPAGPVGRRGGRAAGGVVQCVRASHLVKTRPDLTPTLLSRAVLTTRPLSKRETIRDRPPPPSGPTSVKLAKKLHRTRVGA